MNYINLNQNVPQGWECPRCKCIYAPTTMMCIRCPQQVKSNVSTGTNAENVCLTFIAPLGSDSSSTGNCIRCGKSKTHHVTSQG